MLFDDSLNIYQNHLFEDSDHELSCDQFFTSGRKDVNVQSLDQTTNQVSQVFLKDFVPTRDDIKSELSMHTVDDSPI